MDDDFKDEVRKIIREELIGFLGSSQYQFQKDAKFYDARNIQVGYTTGTQIATDGNQKLGFYGKVPIVQANSIPFPSGGTVIDAEGRAAVVSLIGALHNLGLIK